MYASPCVNKVASMVPVFYQTPVNATSVMWEPTVQPSASATSTATAPVSWSAVVAYAVKITLL
jgi:hypothetical protein